MRIRNSTGSSPMYLIAVLAILIVAAIGYGVHRQGRGSAPVQASKSGQTETAVGSSTAKSINHPCLIDVPKQWGELSVVSAEATTLKQKHFTYEFKSEGLKFDAYCMNPAEFEFKNAGGMRVVVVDGRFVASPSSYSLDTITVDGVVWTHFANGDAGTSEDSYFKITKSGGVAGFSVSTYSSPEASRQDVDAVASVFESNKAKVLAAKGLFED